MCGIVGAIARRNVMPLLLQGLQRLEYRGYDSAGVAVRQDSGKLKRFRALGKVSALRDLVAQSDISGEIGIAHTRWATHGVPSERNAHPLMSGVRVAVVHNGIIENHADLRQKLASRGYTFTSETDTEVIAHLMADKLESGLDLLTAVVEAASELDGAYALAVVSPEDDSRIVVARVGSPLVIGVGDGEHFIASDVTALLSETKRFIFLEEGDVAEVHRDTISIFNAQGESVQRPVKVSQLSGGS
ncbi:MAG: class II glutamine amidotransferase, partial [Mariprofundaceae bacterium]|nr:class II glutamine amidotransferase [Mariprofundaceae bacterium]